MTRYNVPYKMTGWVTVEAESAEEAAELANARFSPEDLARMADDCEVGGQFDASVEEVDASEPETPYEEARP